MAKIKTLNVKGLDIKYKPVGEEDYISLTDIARQREGEFPSDVVRSWLRTYRTIEFLGIWEQLYNPYFNSVEYNRVKSEAPENALPQANGGNKTPIKQTRAKISATVQMYTSYWYLHI